MRMSMWKRWWRRLPPSRQDRVATLAPLLAVLLFLAAIVVAIAYLRYEELEREQGAATGQPVIIVDSWGNIADEVSEALSAETNDPEEGPDNA